MRLNAQALTLGLGLAGCDFQPANNNGPNSSPRAYQQPQASATCLVGESGENLAIHCIHSFNSGEYMQAEFAPGGNVSVHAQSLGQVPVQSSDLDLSQQKGGLMAWMQENQGPIHEIDLKVDKKGGIEIGETVISEKPTLGQSDKRCEVSSNNGNLVELTCPIDGDPDGFTAMVFAHPLQVEMTTRIARQAVRLSVTELMDDTGGRPVLIMSTHTSLNEPAYRDVVVESLRRDESDRGKVVTQTGDELRQGSITAEAL